MTAHEIWAKNRADLVIGKLSMPAIRSRLYDDKSDEILAKAAKLIAQRGYGLTSVSQIADACDCSKARIYHYFESKEQILYQIAFRHVNTLLDNYRQTVDPAAGPQQRLLIVIKTILNMFKKLPDDHKVFLTELDKLPKQPLDEILAIEREMLSIVRAALEEIHPGLSGDTDINYSSAAMLFLGMVNWTYTWFDHRGAVSGDSLANYIFRLFMEGFQRAEP